MKDIKQRIDELEIITAYCTGASCDEKLTTTFVPYIIKESKLAWYREKLYKYLHKKLDYQHRNGQHMVKLNNLRTKWLGSQGERLC